METSMSIYSITRRIVIFIGIMLPAIFLMACSTSPEVLNIGDKAPEFTLTAADNELISLRDYYGSPVLLYFHMAVG
jgi:hypothetical protein